MVLDLNEAVDFDAAVFRPAESIGEPWQQHPDDLDGASDEEKDQAFLDYFDPKSWRNSAFQPSPTSLRAVLQWSISNKKYELESPDGEIRYVAFSHEPAEKQLIEQQEKAHQLLVEEFVTSLAELFSTSKTSWSFETEHLLDPDSPPEEAPQFYLACFYDRTIIFLNESFRVLLWVGHLRYYG